VIAASQPAARAERTQPKTTLRIATVHALIVGALWQRARRITQRQRSSAPVLRRLSGSRGRREGSRDGGGMMRPAIRPVMRKRPRQQRLAVPMRPSVTRRSGSMCAEQRADLAAAQQGSITWAQYYRKWGPSL